MAQRANLEGGSQPLNDAYANGSQLANGFDSAGEAFRIFVKDVSRIGRVQRVDQANGYKSKTILVSK